MQQQFNKNLNIWRIDYRDGYNSLRWIGGRHGGGNNCVSSGPKVMLPEPVLPKSESIDRDSEPLTLFEETVTV